MTDQISVSSLEIFDKYTDAVDKAHARFSDKVINGHGVGVELNFWPHVWFGDPQIIFQHQDALPGFNQITTAYPGRRAELLLSVGTLHRRVKLASDIVAKAGTDYKNHEGDMLADEQRLLNGQWS